MLESLLSVLTFWQFLTCCTGCYITPTVRTARPVALLHPTSSCFHRWPTGNGSMRTKKPACHRFPLEYSVRCFHRRPMFLVCCGYNDRRPGGRSLDNIARRSESATSLVCSNGCMGPHRLCAISLGCTAVQRSPSLRVGSEPRGKLTYYNRHDRRVHANTFRTGLSAKGEMLRQKARSQILAPAGTRTFK